jgi:hypothetical protein
MTPTTPSPDAAERSRQRMIELVEKNWERNKDVPYEEIERHVEATIRAVRGKAGAARKRSR